MIFDDALPAWDERTRQPADAEPGSSLAGDIKIYPNVAAVAWQGITSAGACKDGHVRMIARTASAEGNASVWGVR